MRLGGFAEACRCHLFVRNMDLGLPRAGDKRNLEVVVDGLPLDGGAQQLTPRWSVH